MPQQDGHAGPPGASAGQENEAALPEAARRSHPPPWLSEELELVRRRRGAVDAPAPEELVGLALSRGGIRSATFGLGVLQGLADAKLLRSVDLLSTVSGGGYIGSFLGSIFARLPAPDSAHASEAPSRTHAEDVLRGDFARRTGAYGAGAVPIGWSLQWLRNSGRYLAPTGAGDYVYAVALQLRNLGAIHFVLGLAIVLVAFAAMLLDHWMRLGGHGDVLKRILLILFRNSAGHLAIDHHSSGQCAAP